MVGSENVDGSFGRSKASANQHYDVVDDASDANFLLIPVAKWISTLLGGIQLHTNGYTIFYNRLGESITCTKTRARSTGKIIRTIG